MMLMAIEGFCGRVDDTIPVLLVLLAPIGAGIGAVARDSLVHAFRTRLKRADLGIFAAQVIACFVSGVFAHADATAAALFVAGFAGGLSTWSSLAVELVGSWRERQWSRLMLHLPGALALSVLALLIGRSMSGVAS